MDRRRFVLGAAATFDETPTPLSPSYSLRSGVAMHHEAVPTFWPASEVRWLHERDPELVKL
jgi:hypothetical protein